jgi:hypothetical protein
MEQMIEFEWIVPESQRDSRVAAIEVSGGTVESSGDTYQPTSEEVGDYLTAGFEPLTMIVAVGSVVFVAQALTKMWRDRHVTGGVVIDTRGGKLRVRPVDGLPPGRLVVVAKTGTKIFDKEEENAGKALLSDVLARYSRP